MARRCCGFWYWRWPELLRELPHPAAGVLTLDGAILYADGSSVESFSKNLVLPRHHPRPRLEGSHDVLLLNGATAAVEFGAGRPEADEVRDDVVPRIV